jgi:type IV pilus assembly protein PilP
MSLRPFHNALLLVCVLSLGGCAGNISDVQTEVARIKALEPPPLDPLPVIKTFETFTYVPNERRDPFTTDVEEDAEVATQSGPRPNPERRKELLEGFPLDSLDMVGTIGGGATGLVALVKDPEGTIHRVSAGNYLGENDGRIVGVNEEGINLVELISNGIGGFMERKASISLENTKI